MKTKKKSSEETPTETAEGTLEESAREPWIGIPEKLFTESQKNILERILIDLLEEAVIELLERSAEDNFGGIPEWTPSLLCKRTHIGIQEKKYGEIIKEIRAGIQRVIPDEISDWIACRILE